MPIASGVRHRFPAAMVPDSPTPTGRRSAASPFATPDSGEGASQCAASTLVIRRRTTCGVGHTLPFVIPDFHAALVVAIGVVVVELLAISLIRDQFMDTLPLRAAMQGW